ncbi:hypothetical protein [Endozoicomonas ascidiicola]|uniref:hypothetical protein n=1 Tax=Endozoicomonas ascidiicola TaxID=1698521 RepID=UPI0012F94355|nr:hypothetical protein [Endozoicomonas ascidiicola]
MGTNERALIETNMELEALQDTRTRTPEEHRRKTARILFLGDVKRLIELVEKKDGR